MAVVSALRRTPGALARNPVVFLPMVVLVALQFPQLIAQTVDPILASVVSLGLTALYIFVVPFVQGGLIAMADEALESETSLDTFLDAGRANYVSLLVVYFGLVAVNAVLGFLAVFAGVFLAIGFIVSAGDGVGLAVSVVAGLVLALAVLAYLLVGFFVQFYAQAVVLDGFSASDGLKQSVRVVRGNLASTFGYSLVILVVSLVLGGGVALVSYVSTPPTGGPASPELTLTSALLLGGVLTVFGTLLGGAFAVYSVAFYRELRPPECSKTGAVVDGQA